jgi:uncharacterized protein YoxC
MQPWTQVVLAVCAVALTAALVVAVLALRRVLGRIAAVLHIVEQELRPLIGQVNGLSDELRELTREARNEVAQIRQVTERLQVLADGLARVVTGLAGLARVGQLFGLAAGLRRGADVFVQRLRRG